MDQSLDLKLKLHRIFSPKDNLEIGTTRNQFDQMHYWLTHHYPLSWANCSMSYEIDNKHLKFITRERSLVFRFSPHNALWNLRLESVFRKNLVDQYSSRKYILNDSLPSVKNSIGIDFGSLF